LPKRFRIENAEVHYKGYNVHANDKNWSHPKHGLTIGTLEMLWAIFWNSECCEQCTGKERVGHDTSMHYRNALQGCVGYDVWLVNSQ
jgi:hypothetical protein